MRKLWERLVRWLARDQIAYLEYENRELRYEGELWRHRYDGAIAAVRVFEARSNHMWQTIVDSQSLNSLPPIIVRQRPDKGQPTAQEEGGK